MKNILDISLIEEINKTGYAVIKKFVPIELIEKIKNDPILTSKNGENCFAIERYSALCEIFKFIYDTRIFNKIYQNPEYGYNSDFNVETNANWHDDIGSLHCNKNEKNFFYQDFDLIEDSKPPVVKFCIYLTDTNKNDCLVLLDKFSNEVVLESSIGDLIIFDVRLKHRGKKPSRYLNKFNSIFRKLTKKKRSALFFTIGDGGLLSQRYFLTLFRRQIVKSRTYVMVPNIKIDDLKISNSVKEEIDITKKFFN